MGVNNKTPPPSPEIHAGYDLNPALEDVQCKPAGSRNRLQSLSALSSAALITMIGRKFGNVQKNSVGGFQSLLKFSKNIKVAVTSTYRSF